jgi:hypothetical protein
VLEASSINQILVTDVAGGRSNEQQRNVVLVGGTGKLRLAIAVARNGIRAGGRRRFYRA